MRANSRLKPPILQVEDVIKYTLRCEAEHAFEGWFSSSGDYDSQHARGLVTCPVCGSAKVDKALMAPAVATSDDRTQMAALGGASEQAEMIARMRDMVRAIRENSEDVGTRFPEEARKIHYGEAAPRGIIGQAARDDIASLLDEGIDIAPLPVLPEDTN